MKLDDVLEMFETDQSDERKARRKAAYFKLHEADEAQYQVNRKSKLDFDDEINHRDKRHSPRYDRSKRL